MKRRLFLVGAGDLGLETAFLLGLSDKFTSEFEIVGFLDDNEDALKGKNTELKVVGSTDYNSFSDTDFVLITTANVIAKEKLYGKLKSRTQFYTFISENVLVAPSASIGEGSIICPYSVVSINASIGKCVTVNFGSRIGHDTEIGDFTSIMCNVDIGGHSKIGSSVFMGSGSTVIQKRIIKDHIVLAAGGVVLRNLTKAGTYVGNPVQLIN